MIETALEALQHPTHWHWFTLGVICIILEILLPTFYMLWAGIGAFAMGVLIYFQPDITWQSQLAIFAGLSVFSTVIGRMYLAHKPLDTDEPLLNRRGEQYIGRVVTLNSAIVNGVGHISIDDTRWRIEGPDIASGQKVEVEGVRGTSLVVKSVIS